MAADGESSEEGAVRPRPPATRAPATAPTLTASSLGAAAAKADADGGCVLQYLSNRINAEAFMRREEAAELVATLARLTERINDVIEEVRCEYAELDDGGPDE